MSLADLFKLSSDHIQKSFGVGVTANSASYFSPSGVETVLTSFVFANTTAREFSISPAGDKDSELGEIDVSSSLKIHPKGCFVIDGDTWKIRGRGGRDVNTQSILLYLPKPQSIKQTEPRT